MNAILFVALESFYVRALGATDTDSVAVHREKIVVDATRSASRAGIRIGMSLAEARATSSEVRFVAYRPEDTRSSREEWLDVCAEFSSRIEPAEDHAAYLDFSEHPDPRDAAAILLGRLGRPALAALAGNKWLARLAAETLGAASGTIPHVEDAGAFLYPLPIRWLTPLDPRTRERLEFLGYRTIGSLSCAPISALKGHFGIESSRIVDAARGGAPEAVKPAYPPDSLTVQRRFPGGCFDLQVFSRGIETLARQAAVELANRDRVGQRLRLIVTLEEGGPIVVSRRWSKPMQSARQIVAALNSVLSEVDPARLAIGVTGLRLWLTHLEHAPIHQRNLGVLGVRPIDDTLQRIREVGNALPDGAMIRASDVVESRRRRVLRIWRDATGWH